MTRRSVDGVLMHTAHVWASRGTCSRLQVGAVAARDGRGVVSGYNGAVAGAAHCDHTRCNCGAAVETALIPLHPGWCLTQQPCTVAVHAEANVVAFAARNGIALNGAHLYTTHAPCVACAKLLINAGVVAVTYDQEYRSVEGLVLLRDNGVLVRETS